MYQQHRLQKKIRSQFHQHFMRAFFVRKQIEQLFSSYIWLCNFWHQNFVRKITHKTLIKLNPGLRNALSASGRR